MFDKGVRIDQRPHLRVFVVLSVAFACFWYASSGTAASPAPPANAGKLQDSWVFVCRLKNMGLVIVHLSPFGLIKWETQLADAVGDIKKREIVVFNDQSKRYCTQESKELAAQVARSAELEKHASERRGWKFGEWKKIGTDSIQGFKCIVYERKLLRPGITSRTDKIWIMADSRFAQYKEIAGDILALASRTRLPEHGLPIKRTNDFTDLRPHTALPATKMKQEPVDDPLALLGPPPDQGAHAKVSKPSKPSEQMDSNVEYTLLSAHKEKTDPNRFKIPTGYTRVKNYIDVLGLGGLDGALSY
jgi:hypothetical protein